MPKLNICEKKEKQFWKTCYTTNFSIFAKEKKTSPFSLKDLCKIYFVQKTKRTFLKTSCCRLVYKKEKKNKAFVYKASTKKQRFQAELFFLPTFQNEESKKQTNEVRSFFSFCQDNMTVVQHKETFFCFTIVQNQQAFDNCLWLKKKAALFSCLRSWEVTKKVWSEICNEK